MITEIITIHTSDGKVFDLTGVYDYLWVHNAKTGKMYKWVKGTESGKGYDVGGGSLIASNGFTPFKRKNSMTPRKAKIKSITKGNPTTVEIDGDLPFTINQIVRFSVQSTYGMTQINRKQGKILSVDTAAKKITVDIDSTNFTDFTIPDPVKGTATLTLAGISPGCDGICGSEGLVIGSETYGITLGTSVVGANGDTLILQGGAAMEACNCG
jgi:hypothetical protein